MTETVDYEVVRVLGPVEIRKYPLMTLATVSTPYDNTGFSILFSYISGNNEPNERLAMTAPVISQHARGERIAMTSPVIAGEGSFSFVLPSRYSPQTAPRPRDPRIKLVDIPPRYVAAVRFSGHAYAREVISMEHLLLDTLEGHRIRARGLPFLMRYNSPFAPGFLRRNEVGVEIVGEDLGGTVRT